MAVDFDEVMSRWAAAGFELRLEPVPGGWRCAVREGHGGWTSLAAARPGAATPSEALAATDAGLAALVAAREKAAATEALEALAQALAAGAEIRPAAGGAGWIAGLPGGVTTGPAASPGEAAMAWREGQRKAATGDAK